MNVIISLVVIPCECESKEDTLRRIQALLDNGTVRESFHDANIDLDVDARMCAKEEL
jgi:hypothetical protein